MGWMGMVKIQDFCGDITVRVVQRDGMDENKSQKFS